MKWRFYWYFEWKHYLCSILLQNLYFYHYQNNYNDTEDMFLFNGFSSLITIFSGISSLLLHELLAKIEKSLGETTALQKSI